MSEQEDELQEEPEIQGPHPRVLQRQQTDNPHINRIFQSQAFGQVPMKAVELLEKVSPDSNELLVYAVRTRHGQWKRGYLLLTTRGVRWVQTLPVFAEDLYSFDWKIEYKRLGLLKGLLTTADGDQFQLLATKAKAFRDLFYQLAQAGEWQVASDSESAQEAVQQGDLAGQLRELSDLHGQGVLSDDEFAAAKARLLGSS
jgi:hypothetical protein